jgi:hypothetical protein
MGSIYQALTVTSEAKNIFSGTISGGDPASLPASNLVAQAKRPCRTMLEFHSNPRLSSRV